MGHSSTTISGSLFTVKDLLITGILSAVYLVTASTLLGFKTDQVILVGIFNTLYFFSPATRRFITGFSTFIVFWILFDFMKAFPNYVYNSVHIQDLYHAERHLFGIQFQGRNITPNEFFRLNSSTSLNILTGLFYLCWIPVPLGFAAYLYMKDRRLFLRFSITFLLVNLLGFMAYYIYPAAPPWYVEKYGFGFIENTPGNAAGLLAFDQFFNIPIFTALYAKSSNVFAAMPSLHSSYPLIVLYFTVKYRIGWVGILLSAMVTAGIWFAAVYTGHHYLLDVLFGIGCALLGIALFNLLVEKSNKMITFLDRFLNLIQRS